MRCFLPDLARNWRLRLFCTILGPTIGLGFAIPSNAQNQNTSNQQVEPSKPYNFPGGIAQLSIPKLSGNLPVVKFGIQEPPIVESGEYWRVLIGLDLEMLPGEYLVYVKQSDADLPATSVKFKVAQKFYPFTNIENLGSAVLSRDLDHDKFSEVDFVNSEQPQLPLRLPVKGDWKDVFGSVAATNDQLSSSTESLVQNYVYLNSTNLSIITAPQNAMVSRIIQSDGSQALATVFLDHGRGVYSILNGVADLSVEVGNGVVAGAVIGKLPSSLNPDQPSTLIWQSIVNGVYVNPLILTELQ